MQKGMNQLQKSEIDRIKREQASASSNVNNSNRSAGWAQVAYMSNQLDHSMRAMEHDPPAQATHRQPEDANQRVNNRLADLGDHAIACQSNVQGELYQSPTNNNHNVYNHHTGYYPDPCNSGEFPPPPARRISSGRDSSGNEAW